MSRSCRPIIEIIHRYVGQNPETWYVFCDREEEIAYYSFSIMESNSATAPYENNFTPINPHGTIVTWQDLHGTIRDYQQQLSSTPSPQPQSDRNDNSPFLASYEIDFTPINPRETIVTWQGLQRTIRDYQQQPTSSLSPQPQSDRNDNSPFLNPIPPQACQLAQTFSRTTHLPSDSQMTHVSRTFPQPQSDTSGNSLVPRRPLQARPMQIPSSVDRSPLESRITNTSRTFPQSRHDRSGNFLVPSRPPRAPLAQIHSRPAPAPTEGQVTKISPKFPQPRRVVPQRLLQASLAQIPSHRAPSVLDSQVTNMSKTTPQKRDRSGNLLSQSPSYATPLPSQNQVTNVAGASAQPRRDGGDNSLVIQRQAQAPLTGILSFTTPSPYRKRLAEVAAASLRNMSGNSLVTQPPSQAPLMPILRVTASSPSRKRRTDSARTSSGNLVESDWPGTPSLAYTYESHISSTDRSLLGPPADSSHRPKQPIRTQSSRPNSTPVPQANALYQTPPSNSIGPSSSKLSPPSTTTTTTTTRRRAPAAPPICQNCKGLGHNKRNCPVLWCSYCNTDMHQYGECPLAKAASIVEADTKAALSLKRAMEKHDQEEEEWTPQKGKKRSKKN